jgi:hypothetical protein
MLASHCKDHIKILPSMHKPFPSGDSISPTPGIRDSTSEICLGKLKVEDLHDFQCQVKNLWTSTGCLGTFALQEASYIVRNLRNLITNSEEAQTNHVSRKIPDFPNAKCMGKETLRWLQIQLSSDWKLHEGLQASSAQLSPLNPRVMSNHSFLKSLDVELFINSNAT